MLWAVTAMFAVRDVSANEGVAGSRRASWSPDSSMVAFILSGQGGSDALHVADSDGSNARSILGGERLQAVAWAPNGEHIAVTAAAADDQAVLYVTDPRGAGRRTIELGGTAGDLNVGWSMDSTRIVVQGNRSILIISPDKEEVENLDYADPAVTRVFLNGSSPLAPDNKLLLAAGPVDVFRWTFGYSPVTTGEADANDDRQLWLVKVEGSRHSLPVMQYGDLAGPPVWAPDGRAIAFVTEARHEGPPRVRAAPRFLMNIVSEVGTLLTAPVQMLNPLSLAPIWSSAGTDVAFFWRDATGRTLLNTVNTRFTTVVPLQERLNRVLFAAWTEPATMFAVAVTADDDTICSTVDLETGELTRLSTVPVRFDYVMPSPDLSKLLLQTAQGDTPVLEIYDVSTGSIVQIAS
jgi:Tol biopolymer transport system component